jgi:non-ribosomal peptide synthetase component F
MTGTGTHTTVTQRLVSLGPARGEHPALVGGGAAWPGRTLSYAGLAMILQTAAAGLARRGVRSQDIVGVYVPDAVSYLLAVHAVRAAGGIPCPIGRDATVAMMSGQLTDCGARLLITAGPRTGDALRAADDAWVRQVISFDEEPGTIPFCSLLSMGWRPPAPADPDEVALLPYPGDGTLAAGPVSYRQLAVDLQRLSASAPITGRDVVLAAPPNGNGRDYSVLLDLALLEGATVVAACPESLPDAARAHGGTAAIVHPGTSIPAELDLRAVTAAC